MIMNNPSDKPEDTATTVTIGNEPKEVTFSDKQIKYYELTYSCIHGGREFQAKGDGKRATQ